MKHIKLFEEYIETRFPSLNEAFKSAKLASIFTGAGAIPEGLPKAFYRMTKLKLDKIEDEDIIEMSPSLANRERRANAVYLYFTTNEKQNEYTEDENSKTIPANTLLAITDGNNDWMNVTWTSNWALYPGKKKGGLTLSKSKRDDSAGYAKSPASGTYGTGISSMKKVALLADRAYVLDLDVLKARYSSADIIDARKEAKTGAIAYKSDKDFKADNKRRYSDIIANRAAKMPIDKLVFDAIDDLTLQIKDGIKKGAKTKYGDIMIGVSTNKRDVKLSDASYHMKSILDDFSRYVEYTDNAKKETEAGYGNSYYDKEVKQYAKKIIDKINQIKGLTYA